MIPAAHSPASALLAHVESLLTDSRVLVVGNASHLLAEHALDRGARLVQVLDPDSRRVAGRAAHNTERRISYAQLTEGSLRDASFDVAIVENLGESSNPGRLLQGVKRSLSVDGYALVVIGNQARPSPLFGTTPGSLTFEDLEDLTMDVFESVTMLGQAPFVGYSVVSLDIDEPPVPALDNGFLKGAPDGADYFAALCGSREALARARLEDMSIVQFSAEKLLGESREAALDAERRARRHVESIETELERLRSRSSSAEVERLTRELEKQGGFIRELEARAESADARADDAEADRERLEKELARRSTDSNELTLLKERLDDQLRVADRSQKEARWAEERVKKLEAELEAALMAAEAGGSSDALGRLEEEVEELETELEETHQELLAAARELAAKNAALERSERDVSASRHALEAAKREAEGTRRELERQTAAVRSLEAELRDSASKVASLEAELTREKQLAREKQSRAEAIAASEKAAREAAESGAAGREVAALEAQLVERGQAVLALEQQLRDLELYAKGLVARLERSPEGPVADPEEDARRVALERAVAEREADLVSLRWTVAELEQRLSARPA